MSANDDLIIAAKQNDLEAFRAALKAGGVLNAQDSDGKAALHWVVINDADTNLILYILWKGADANVKDNTGNTPLHYAVAANNERLVRWLIENQADITLMDASSKTATQLAISKNFTALANLLPQLVIEHRFLSSIISDNQTEFNNLLTIAAQTAQQAQWTNKINIEGTMTWKMTMNGLQLAAFFKKDWAIQTLLGNGIAADNYIAEENDISISKKTTPLMLACLEKSNTTAELLINAGANVNALSTRTETPLWFASYRQYPYTTPKETASELVQLLLVNDANPKYASGDTSIFCNAVWLGADAVINLIETSNRINAPNRYNVNEKKCPSARPLLSWAIWNYNSFELTQYLLTHYPEIDVNLSATYIERLGVLSGATAMHYAYLKTFKDSYLEPEFLLQREQRELIADLLIQYGANSSIICPCDNKTASELRREQLPAVREYYFNWLNRTTEGVDPSVVEKRLRQLEKESRQYGITYNRTLPESLWVYPREIRVSELDPSLGFAIYNNVTETQFGIHVDTIGDVNHDDIGDVGVTAFESGEIYIVLGNTALSHYNETTPSHLLDFTAQKFTGPRTTGRVIRYLGDVDGDQVDDFAFASSYSELYIVFGHSPFTFNTSNMLRISAYSNHYFGSAIAQVGDVNKDGFNDIFVGSNGVDYNTTVIDSGAAYIIQGGAYLKALETTTITELEQKNKTLKFFPSERGGRAGFYVSSAGDLNQDGYTDFAIAADLSDANNRYRSGEVYVAFGSSKLYELNELNLSLLDGDNGFILQGAKNHSRLGTSITTTDFNADGFSDLIVGAPGQLGGNDNGTVYIFFSNSNFHYPRTVDLSLFDFNQGEGVTIHSKYLGDHLGSHLAALGDVNGDCLPDLAMGAESAEAHILVGQAHVLFGSPAFNQLTTFALSDLNGTNGFSVLSARRGDGLGAVGPAGDLDNDGLQDTIFGARLVDGPEGNTSHAGAAYIIWGRPLHSSVNCLYPPYQTTFGRISPAIATYTSTTAELYDSLSSLGTTGIATQFLQNPATTLSFVNVLQSSSSGISLVLASSLGAIGGASLMFMLLGLVYWCHQRHKADSPSSQDPPSTGTPLGEIAPQDQFSSTRYNPALFADVSSPGDASGYQALPGKPRYNHLSDVKQTDPTAHYATASEAEKILQEGAAYASQYDSFFKVAKSDDSTAEHYADVKDLRAPGSHYVGIDRV